MLVKLEELGYCYVKCYMIFLGNLFCCPLLPPLLHSEDLYYPDKDVYDVELESDTEGKKSALLVSQRVVAYDSATGSGLAAPASANLARSSTFCVSNSTKPPKTARPP